MKFLTAIIFGFCLLAFTPLSYAQLCTGSLGDPVVSLTFGAGTATHAGTLAAGTTSYTYSSADFPTDGSYTIENTTAGAGTVWWSTTDHTGNTGGYMMVVNASVSKTDYFYKSTVSGLCPGTTYEFAAWVVNLLRSRDISPPDITFSISTTGGTVLGTYNTGTIPLNATGAVWKQYGFFFTTPANVSDVVIQMTNNSSGGAPANDLALDDITFRPCGPIATADIVGSGATSQTICAGNNTTVDLEASVSTGYTTPQYQWQVNTGSGWTDIAGATSTKTTITLNNATTGTYLYRLSVGEAATFASAQCRVASNVITLTVNPIPTVTTSGDVTLCTGDGITFTATGGTSYLWTGPNNFSSTLQNPSIPSVTTANAGTYTLMVTSSSGCSASASLNVTVGAYPAATISPATTICEGTGTTLTATGGTTYQWSPATGLSGTTIANPVANPTVTTTYTVKVYDATATCPAINSVKITVLAKPVANAGFDKKITQGQAVTLNGTAKGDNVTYYWTPVTGLSSSTILNPVATPADNITYTLHVVSGCGTATDDVFVRVYKKITIPNTFTPNNDGINDTWDIDALDTYPDATIQVYNRYGGMVLNSIGYGKPWDGRFNGQNLPAGTYYYVIDLKNGNKFSGWVLIVR